jgi:hypothetical protein
LDLFFVVLMFHTQISPTSRGICSLLQALHRLELLAAAPLAPLLPAALRQLRLVPRQRLKPSHLGQLCSSLTHAMHMEPVDDGETGETGGGSLQQLHKTGEFFVGLFLWLFFVVKSVFLVDLMMSI